jgi:hypothetical protein
MSTDGATVTRSSRGISRRLAAHYPEHLGDRFSTKTMRAGG